ncbi:MAG: hypothetical protein JNJ98_11795 [Gemmatimonadetes bacterium]|nr:hypothetical protein [Gemmatimonadota bacterium]
MNRYRFLRLAVATLLLGAGLGAQEGGAEQLGAARDTLRGRSGKLLARQVGGARGGPIRILQELFGDSAVRRHGIYRAELTTGPLSFINLMPFGAKTRGRVGRYLVGTWPREGRGNTDLPDGFIEVTPDNQDTRLSEHFRLRDFLTHDQANVWPKYVVVREPLLDKLELVIEDLNARGIRVGGLKVLSGFRTPQYNARGVGRGGRARDSRHQYGDAADVFVDDNGDGRPDDLNGDGRSDSRDIRILIESVERVERTHPELSGGLGLYRSTSNHGGFVHVDTRGSAVRWGFS